MPRSIDLSSYYKAATGEEEQWVPHPLCSDDSDSDNTTLLEKHDPVTKKPKESQWLRSPWFFLLDILMVAMVMIYYASDPITMHLSFLGDVTGYIPSFSQQIVTFQSYPEFVSNHTSLESLKEAREHWMKFLPPGQGFIKVQDELYSQFDLPPPIKYKGGNSLGTSMMHSLHCLYEIMAEYDMLAMGLKHPGPDTVHMDHCFDYVRQMLICGGDMALAGEDLPNGSSHLNVPHVCKNYEQMYHWLDEHKDNNQYQFGSAGNHYVPP